MKKIFFLLSAVIFCSIAIFAQGKGVDTQSRKIHEESVKGTQITSNNPTSYDFGKDKTKVRKMLDNPYRLSARRDALVETVIDVLKEKRLIVDESASRLKEGFIVTQPFIFSKGAQITQSGLARYAILPNSDAIYTRARYSLTIEIQSIDGVQNNVSVTAKIDGKAESGLTSEWTTLQSSGVAEDEFLAKLIEAITGTSPDEQPNQ